tara:strand:+ start:571 stop:1047 length:477 start_codon:yes stop_codon:yes gene_type:complete
MTDTDEPTRWRQAVAEHMASVPGPPEEQLAEFKKMRQAFHAELAKAASPVMASLIASKDDETLSTRRSICSWANGELRSLGLAARCPKSNQASILVADPRDREDERGRFRLEHQTEKGRSTKTFSSVHAPALELMEDTPRRESFAGKMLRDSLQGPMR